MQLEQGKTYRVKLTSGAWVRAEFLEDSQYGPGLYSSIRTTTRYHFRNLKSGRTITLKSQRKIKADIEGAL